MNNLLRKFPQLFNNHARTLLLEQHENGVVVTRVEEHMRTHVRTVGKGSKFTSLDTAGKQQMSGGNIERAVLVLNAGSASTIKSVVHITREYPEEAITEGELDAVLFRALWSFLNRFRPLAATKLGVSELDLVVANIAVCGVRIHKAKVFNPLDFKGEEMIIEFRGTFIPREILPSLEALSVHIQEPLMVVERGAILAEALQCDAIFADIGDTLTDLYLSRAGEITHIGRCDWGVKSVVEKLGNQFGVQNRIVGDVLKSYTKNQMSEKLRNMITSIVRKELASLREYMDTAVKRVPEAKRAPYRFAVHAEHAFPQGLIEDARMHAASFPEARAAETAEMLLSYYPYVHPQYAFLNQLLRRRVKWLVPHE